MGGGRGFRTGREEEHIREGRDTRGTGTGKGWKENTQNRGGIETGTERESQEGKERGRGEIVKGVMEEERWREQVGEKVK
jgi:hypothetical protein